MTLSDEFIAKVRKDFDNSGLESWQWDTFLKGYIACLKRFGGRK